MKQNKKYKRLDFIEGGSFGQVFEVERETDGKRLASKVIKLPNSD